LSRHEPFTSTFVGVNQRVKKGDPLCLIEVMKLLTTIPAPTDGLLKVIAVEDAAPVEFDQILFVIMPDTLRCRRTSHRSSGSTGWQNIWDARSNLLT
jgi:hypothetical protein